MVDPTSGDSTTNPLSGETDAVTEPDAILNASSLKALCGISNKPLPLPLKNEAVTDCAITLSDTNKLPLNVPPTFDTNPSTSEIDAVAEPLAILKASSDKAANGMLNNPLPSPLIIPSTLKEPVISVEPVICCISVNSSPNIFEPDE